jgi:predicted Zn finger-like uncharacterized protein
MDVKCERCNTEYEFDDALVSGRGTTVKCTNCGHKFKIRRSDGDFSEDFWNVTTGDGRTLVFTSLRELQRAIQGYLVERNDRLSRGGLPPKAIGQIPELAPFFDQREAAKKNASGKTTKTQDGLGPAADKAAAAGPVRARQPTKPEFPAPPASDPNLGTATPAFTGKATLVGTGSLPTQASTSPAPPTERQPAPAFDSKTTAPMPPPAAAAAASSSRREPQNTAPLARPIPAGAVAAAQTLASAPPRAQMPSIPPPLPERARRSSPSVPNVPAEPARSSLQGGVSAPPPVASAVSRRPSSNGDAMRPPLPPPPPRDPYSSDRLLAAPAPMVDASSPIPPEHRPRSLLAEIEDERDRSHRNLYGDDADVPPRRRGVGGFIVATVVVLCLAMLGVVWAQKNLGVTLGTKPPPPAAPALDPRVSGFSSAGEKALGDGNIELAKESFDKASALAEKDPHVLLDLARLAAVRADVLWLKSRLLPQDALDEHRVTRDSLVELAGGARKAADDALAAAPDDPAALRAKIDVLRISGDRDGARALVGKISASASQPESAYVLAALDLAEVEPLWPGLIERLKTAANVETGPGRARAALVYALARSGDGVEAKAEVERLAAMSKPHPLLPLLRAFADKAKVVPKGDAGAVEALASADPSARNARPGIGTPPPVPVAGGTPPPAGGGGPIPSDTRDLVSQGERARARGDYDRARTLFNAAVDKNPNDSEALSGLAAIAYAQRDLAGARTSFKRVLGINPNYMPALVGLADVEWDSGDKATATKMYKDIVDRYPEGSYPLRVKSRSDGGT